MQQCALFVLALLAAPVAGSSLSVAKAWLQSHKSPTDDQLGELRDANPQAFALVNALLNKHAKGEIKLSADERGPDVFRRMMQEDKHLSAAAVSHPEIGEASAPLPYAAPEAQPAVVDQVHYNPKTAADRDESSVDKLLSAVAAMGGEKGKKIALLRQRRNKNKGVEENALTQDSDLLSDFSQPAQPVDVPAIVPASAQPVEVPVQEQAAPAPEAKHENSYLKGIDLSGDMPVAHDRPTQHMSEGADLSHFSFGEDAAPVAPPAPKKVVAPLPKKEEGGAFLKYLGFVNKAPAPEEQPAKPVAVNPKDPKENPYLAGLMA